MSIDVSTSWRHFERSCARIHAVLRPRIWGWRSSSAQLYGAMSALVDLPGVANPLDDWLMAARRMREWSCDGSALARCPNRRRRLFVITDVTESWLVLCLTSSLVICAVYGICTIRQTKTPLVKCIKTSTGGHSHTPRVSSIMKNWEYAHKSWILVCKLMEDHQMLRSSDFMHGGPFQSSCRYQAHSLRVHLCRIQGRQRSRQPQRHGRVLIPWKEELKCRQKLVILFYSSWFLVRICEDSSCSISTARRHHPHSLNPYRSPRPQLHQENLYGQHSLWSNPWVPEKVQELQHSTIEGRYAIGLISWAASEGLTVSSLICDCWLICKLATFTGSTDSLECWIQLTWCSAAAAVLDLQRTSEECKPGVCHIAQYICTP